MDTFIASIPFVTHIRGLIMITIYNTEGFPFCEAETVHEAEDILSHADEGELIYYPSLVEPNDCPNYIESLNRGWQ